jgi:hypothetical protein
MQSNFCRGKPIFLLESQSGGLEGRQSLKGNRLEKAASFYWKAGAWSKYPDVSVPHEKPHFCRLLHCPEELKDANPQRATVLKRPLHSTGRPEHGASTLMLESRMRNRISVGSST